MWTEAEKYKYDKIAAQEWKYRNIVKGLKKIEKQFPADPEQVAKDLECFEVQLTIKKEQLEQTKDEERIERLENQIKNIDKRRIRATNILNGFPPKPLIIKV